jgi:hypothetical protein
MWIQNGYKSFELREAIVKGAAINFENEVTTKFRGHEA